MASNVFSMQGAAKPTVEGTQLGLEQGPVRKTPTLLIERTQISLSDPLPCFYSKRSGEGLLQMINVFDGKDDVNCGESKRYCLR